MILARWLEAASIVLLAALAVPGWRWMRWRLKTRRDAHATDR